MYIIITNDDGTVLSQKKVPDDTALTSCMEVFESAFRYADLRRCKGETDPAAGVYLPTGNECVLESEVSR